MGFGWDTKQRLDDAGRLAVQTIRTTPVLGGRIKSPVSREEISSRFQYVELSKKVADLDHFPDFLLVGPQRTGTTWLHSNLSQHPQIFMPKRKEIYYFNTLNLPDHVKHRTNDLAWYLSYFYPGPLRYLSDQFRCRRDFGEPFRPLVRGEATSSLAAMPQELIREVVRLNPDIKVVILVRNPIERAWSHAKLGLLRRPGRRLNEVPAEEFDRFFHNQYEIDCGHVTKILANWSEALRDGNLFIGNYEDVGNRPHALLTMLFEFLGVKVGQDYIPQQVEERINATARMEIPVDFREILRSIYADELERLRDSGFAF